jgi:hypothetical protein
MKDKRRCQGMKLKTEVGAESERRNILSRVLVTIDGAMIE